MSHGAWIEVRGVLDLIDSEHLYILMESFAQPFRWRAIVLFIGFLVAHVRIFTLVSLTRNGMAMVSIFVLPELLYDCFYTHRYYTLEHAWPPIPQLCSFFFLLLTPFSSMVKV